MSNIGYRLEQTAQRAKRQRKELRRLNRQIHEVRGRLKAKGDARDRDALKLFRANNMLNWLERNFAVTAPYIKEFRKTGGVPFESPSSQENTQRPVSNGGDPETRLVEGRFASSNDGIRPGQGPDVGPQTGDEDPACAVCP